MIKVHVAAGGTKSFQDYERARVRDKCVEVGRWPHRASSTAAASTICTDTTACPPRMR